METMLRCSCYCYMTHGEIYFANFRFDLSILFRKLYKMPQIDCPVDLSDSSQHQSLTSSSLSDNNSGTNRSLSSLERSNGGPLSFQSIVLPNQQRQEHQYRPQPTLFDSLVSANHLTFHSLIC